MDYVIQHPSAVPIYCSIYIVDLRAKVHVIIYCLRLYNTKLLPSVVTGRQLEVLVLLYGSSSKLLIKWQGPFEVKWQAREVKYEVMQMDSGNLMQIYHVNHPSRAHW